MIVMEVYGYNVLLDDIDYERLKDFTWCIAHMTGGYYAVRSVKRKRVYMHHDIIGKPPLGLVTDHINRNPLDNRKENLRHVTYSENARNKLRSINATFVHYENGRYRARPYINGVRINLGNFMDKDEAERVVREYINAK